MKTFEGNKSVGNVRIALICSRWNDVINNKLIENAERKLLKSGIKEDNICLYRVPGALEIPRMANLLSEEEEFEAIICLGTLLDNSITFQFKAAEITRSLLDISVNGDTPIINAVIMAKDTEEAMNLADEEGINYGSMAVLSALETLSLEKNM